MRTYYTSIIIFAGFISVACFCSCNEDVTTANLRYTERLVVSGILRSGSRFVQISISRTFPLTETFSIEKTAVSDASVQIIVDGRSYPLLHDSLGIYHAPGLVVQEGKTYELTADWNGKHIQASTAVPFAPNVISSSLGKQPTSDGMTTVETQLLARSHEAYGQTWEIHTGGSVQSGGTVTDMQLSSNAEMAGMILLRERYRINFSPTDTLYAVVHAYDQCFYYYFISRGGNEPGQDDLLFRNTGSYVNWNVAGDGIGIFVGEAVTMRAVQPSP